jgi:hypothetical protein
MATEFRLLAGLPSEGKMLVLEKLIEWDRISPKDAQRFLFEFLPMEGVVEVAFAEVELAVRIHARVGDAQRAWRAIEKWGNEGIERLLKVFIGELCNVERFEMLAELPLTPVAVEILGGFGEDG